MTAQSMVTLRFIFARDRVREYVARSQQDGMERSQDRKAFADAAVSAPAMIRFNGLGPATAQLASAGRSGGAIGVAASFATWLIEENRFSPYHRPDSLTDMTPRQRANRLVARISESNAREYRAAQSEAAALAVWLKRLSEALLADEEDR